MTSGMNEEISILKITPRLPREVWKIVFNVLPIRHKLFSSRAILEFREFYAELLEDYSRYAACFRDFDAEWAALLWLNTWPPVSQNRDKLLCFPRSVFMLDSSMNGSGDIHYSGTESRLNNRATFDDDVGEWNKYSTYLTISNARFVRFQVKDVFLPTGKYNIYYKIRSLCKSNAINRFYQITVQHKLSLKRKIGFIDHWKYLMRKFGDSGAPPWKWVPVYKDTCSNELLTVDYSFEDEDELSVELFASSPGVTVLYHLHFHVITFVSIDQ